jgi:molybdopterin-synthase adenylyltransferase
MNLQRQSFLGPDSEAVISAVQVAVVGLCGGGSHVAQQLGHIGFKNLHLVDHDHADDTNINRMVGLTAADVKAKEAKTQVISRNLRAVHPKALPQLHACRWQERQTALKGCAAIFGCVDSYSEREQLERFCRRYNIIYIDVGMDVFGDEGAYFISGQTIMSLPKHACMRCMGFLTEELLAKEAADYGKAGGKPQVVWPNGTLASAAVGLLMGVLTPWNASLQPPLYLEYDGNRSTLTPSRRLQYINEEHCPHFQDITARGDVFWN